MKTYQCHKRVKGAPIVSCDVADNVVTYRASDGSEQGYGVPASFFARGIPPAGVFLVEYDGGYASWSPTEPFKDGYAEISGKTLEAYFRDAARAGIIDFAVRAHAVDGHPVTFYVHPHGRDGETLDFAVRGNGLAAK